MGTEQRRNRPWVKWTVLSLVMLAMGAIWIGVARTPPDTNRVGAGESSTQPASDEEGSDGKSSADESPKVEENPTARTDPTEPPRDIAIDPQGTRPTASPATVSAPTDGSGAELEPVSPGAVVEVQAGAEISLARIEAVDGQATVGGEIAGPAVRVSVSIANLGTESIDLDYVVVNAYWGEDRTPAGTVMQPGGVPFSGSVDPGAVAEGIYLFSISEADRSDVVITVDHGVGEPIVVFRGDLR